MCACHLIDRTGRELVGAVSSAARTESSPKKVRLPMPATTYFISSALKKLRVKSMNNDNFEKCELWRGMKNLTTNQDFIKTGGRIFPLLRFIWSLYIS